MEGVEVWKHLVNYENYEVSSFGKVRNKNTGRILKLVVMVDICLLDYLM